jgi:two-component system OmpR family response regulator
MGSRPVVLVVEDEWLLRASIAAHLCAARLRNLEARSGEAAVSLLETGEHFDVVITDIQLAGVMSGWEVALMFRRVLPLIPVIYTSGNALEPELAVPKSRFFAKPYEPIAVVDACRAYLREGLDLC